MSANLQTGRWYEYIVRGVNSAGEGPTSGTDINTGNLPTLAAFAKHKGLEWTLPANPTASTAFDAIPRNTRSMRVAGKLAVIKGENYDDLAKIASGLVQERGPHRPVGAQHQPRVQDPRARLPRSLRRDRRHPHRRRQRGGQGVHPHNNQNPIDPGYGRTPRLAEETKLSRRDLYAIGAGIAMLAGGVAGCSPGHGAEPDSSAPPSVVASQVATPDASAAPTTAAASNIKDGQTSDGRAYASLRPGDTLASADYVGALRAGINMYRFGDGSAAVVDPSGTPPDAVIADVASGVGDGLDMRSSRGPDVVSTLRNSGVRAFIVRPIYTEFIQDGWMLSFSNIDGFVPDGTGDTARPTVEEAIAARQADIDAHPDVVIIGPDGIIPRG